MRFSGAQSYTCPKCELTFGRMNLVETRANISHSSILAYLAWPKRSFVFRSSSELQAWATETRNHYGQKCMFYIEISEHSICLAFSVVVSWQPRPWKLCNAWTKNIYIYTYLIIWIAWYFNHVVQAFMFYFAPFWSCIFSARLVYLWTRKPICWQTEHLV